MYSESFIEKHRNLQLVIWCWQMLPYLYREARLNYMQIPFYSLRAKQKSINFVQKTIR